MKILRVFLKRTPYTPKDNMVLIGMPPVDELIPEHDEVHITCIFTWDKEKCLSLQNEWQARTDKPVKVGGPAFGSKARSFRQGMYIKQNIIFTSRGCNNNCPWCRVRQLEGKLNELPIVPGNWIQDNNFLQCSRRHKDKVFEMLKTQSGVHFMGGLEADLIDDHFLEAVRGLKIRKMFLACDTDAAIPAMERAVKKLRSAGFSQDHIHCYALIGDDMSANEERLRRIYHAGAMPRAQLYRPYEDTKKRYPPEWNAFGRVWSRPCMTKGCMTKGKVYSRQELAHMQVDGQLAMELEELEY